MVEKFDNLLDTQQLKWFREDFDRRFNDPATEFDLSNRYDVEEAKRLFGIETAELDSRVVLRPEDPAHQLISEIMYKVIPSTVGIWAAYCRQVLPQSLHVDAVDEETDMSFAKSAVIPLDENVGGIFKTLVWNKVFFNNRDLVDFVIDYSQHKENYSQLCSVSQTEDVDHCYHGEPNIVDYMEFDGAYNYSLGSVGMFDRTHVHCSSNWRKYGLVDHKDFILLHIG